MLVELNPSWLFFLLLLCSSCLPSLISALLANASRSSDAFLLRFFACSSEACRNNSSLKSDTFLLRLFVGSSDGCRAKSALSSDTFLLLSSADPPLPPPCLKLHGLMNISTAAAKALWDLYTGSMYLHTQAFFTLSSCLISLGLPLFSGFPLRNPLGFALRKSLGQRGCKLDSAVESFVITIELIQMLVGSPSSTGPNLVFQPNAAFHLSLHPPTHSLLSS